MLIIFCIIIFFFNFIVLTRLRHNRKSVDILNFEFGNQMEIEEIQHATLHLYTRGRAWAITTTRQQQQQNRGDILNICIYRVMQKFSNAMNSSNTIKIAELQHKISQGQGDWVQIDLSKQLKNYWQQQQSSTTSLTPLQIIIKGEFTWMRPFIVTSVGKNKPLVSYFYIFSFNKYHIKY